MKAPDIEATEISIHTSTPEVTTLASLKKEDSSSESPPKGTKTSVDIYERCNSATTELKSYEAAAKQEMWIQGMKKKDTILKLKKALYGQKQDPRIWYSMINGYFHKQGFRRSQREITASK